MGGSCSACVVKVIKGSEFLDNEGLHEQIYKGIDSDDILTCIATIKDEFMKTNSEITVKLKPFTSLRKSGANIG